MTAAHDHGLWFLNTRVAIHRASSDSADGLSVMEHWMPHGEAPPLHMHHSEDEVFHVLEGMVRFRVGDVERLAGAGETLVAPKGVPHGFVVESPGGARCLVMTPGPDFEGLIRAMGRPAEAAALPEPAEPTPAQQQALAAAALDRRIKILGPPINTPAGA
ncbi:cupin domain-containing protein [Caulobacter sp. 73W]|uniref:Cupin domain-containing protein n=1 Tax=Caulobacter sp. 73W TaxID=3161137 RepID=A0AB39KW85_9CAUL